MNLRPRSKKKPTLPCGRIQPVSDSSQALLIREKLENFTSKKKLNFSDSRNKIVDVIARQSTHFTALDLVKKVQADHPSVGAATIYRNLPVLVSAGILRESLADENGQVIYEIEGSGHHDHIVCLDCNAILEFHEAGIESLQERVLSKLNFKQARHRHVVYAHCQYQKARKQISD